jgi:Cdc6-like AAA superfamily ATPase
MEVNIKENGQYSFTLLAGSICQNPDKLPPKNKGHKKVVDIVRKRFNLIDKEPFNESYWHIKEPISCSNVSEAIELVYPYAQTPWRDWKVTTKGKLKGHSFRNVKEYYEISINDTATEWQHEYELKKTIESDYTKLKNAVELCEELLKMDDLSKVKVKLYGRSNKEIYIEEPLKFTPAKQEDIIAWLHKAQEKMFDRISNFEYFFELRRPSESQYTRYEYFDELLSALGDDVKDCIVRIGIKNSLNIEPFEKKLKETLPKPKTLLEMLKKGIKKSKDMPDKSKSDKIIASHQYKRSLFINKKTFKVKPLAKLFVTEPQKILALLKRKKNIILQGAPGVGKTFTAKKLAELFITQEVNELGNERPKNFIHPKKHTTFVQFHQSTSYEDFVQGFRPKEAGGFELVKGTFYKTCEKARENPSIPHVLLIDEINRGNLSKIFGELLMLIEADKRGDAHALNLLYEPDKTFSVPENLYIIGMMNTADRSLALIDYALRRRFAFFTLEPQLDEAKKVCNESLHTLIDVVKKLNDAIKEDPSLGKGFQIGHSYFLQKGVTAEEIVTYELIPLLEEYWFDNGTKLQEWTEHLKKWTEKLESQ